MKSYKQDRTVIQPIEDRSPVSKIPAHVRDSGEQIGCIQKATYSRITEINATDTPHMNLYAKGITDMPPGADYAWCSLGHWARKSTFGMVKGLPDRYCRQCRAEQQAKWRASKKR